MLRNCSILISLKLSNSVVVGLLLTVGLAKLVINTIPLHSKGYWLQLHVIKTPFFKNVQSSFVKILGYFNKYGDKILRCLN